MGRKNVEPTEGPPQEGGSQVATAQEAGSSRPQPLTEAQTAQTAGASAAVSGPSLQPPAGGAEATGGAGGVTASTWRSGTVTALWVKNEIRNSWMYVANLGWRKLFNGRDGSLQALTYLASQARQTGRTIQFREEADTMIYEIYLW